MKRFFVFILFFIFYNNLYALCEYSVKENQPYFELKGNWDFFKGSGTIAADPNLDISSWKSINVPFKWFQVKELNNYKGEIWIRCNIVFNFVPQELYLDLGFIKEIDEVYWNGIRVGGTGNFENRIPDFSEKRIYSIPPVLLKENNVLAIRIYGSFWNAGIGDIPKLSFDSSFLRDKNKFEMFAIAFSLTYIFSSTFFIFFGIFTQEKKSNLYFALFSIFLALYQMILWGLRYKFFNNYIVSYIAELLLLIPLPFLFISFIKEWLNLEKIPLYNFIKLFTILLMISALLGYFISVVYRTIYLHIITYINLMNITISLIVIIKTFLTYRKEKYKELKYLFYGLLFLVPFLLNDMLVALDILRTPRMFVFSYPVFLLVMAISLSERTLQLKTQAIRQVDDLRLIEKQKLQVIYNISNEFQSVFDELKQNILLRKNYESALIRLNYLIESAQILHLLESKKYFLQPVKINLTEETLKVIDDVLKATKQKKNRLDINLPKTLTSVWMDIQLYRMILYHLLENALLYTVDEVELTISIEDQSLKIRVYDKGPGIPVELQDKIFDKYVRGNHSKIPGSGIGLTIVKECVMLLSGTIHFESKQDFYTLFEINIRELKEIT